MTSPDPQAASVNVVQSMALVHETEMRINEARARLVRTHISTAHYRQSLEEISARLSEIYEDMRA
ncbi:MAG: hypothetical protein AAFY52_04565 [Pseudomonadota bacterium]